MRLASTRIQRIFRPYPESFENALQRGNFFFIRYAYVYVWTVVFGNLRIRLRHSLGSNLQGEHLINKHGVSKVEASLLVALISSSLISCVQINAAVINLHNQYIRARQDVLRSLSMNSGHHKVKKRANHHRGRFWTRLGRTSAWWDNFINDTMVEEEGRENFRIPKASLLKQQNPLARDNEHCKLRESRLTCQHKIPSRCF